MDNWMHADGGMEYYLENNGDSFISVPITYGDISREEISAHSEDILENFCGRNIKQKSYFHLKVIVPHNHGFYIEQNCVPLLATQVCCLPRYSRLSLSLFLFGFLEDCNITQ